MRHPILTLLSVLLVSCGAGGPKDPPPPQGIAPTVPGGREIEKPSIDVVRPLTDKQAEELGRVRDENSQLRGVVDRVEANADTLAEVLNRTLEEGQADKMRLREINDLFLKERDFGKELRALVDTQSMTIGRLTTTTETLKREVGLLGDRIAVANQRLIEQDDNLSLANQRIRILTTQKDDAVTISNDWKAEVAVEAGKTDAEKRWKWKFFWWGMGATVLLVGENLILLRLGKL